MVLLYVGVRDSIRKAQRREIESVPRVQIRAAVKGGVALPFVTTLASLVLVSHCSRGAVFPPVK